MGGNPCGTTAMPKTKEQMPQNKDFRTELYGRRFQKVKCQSPCIPRIPDPTVIG